MAELRGRSRRLQRQGHPPSYDPYQQPPASRRRRRSASRSAASRRSQSRDASRRKSIQSLKGLRRQGDRPVVPPQSTSTQSGQIVPQSPGALVRSSSRYRSRDGRHMPLGPDASRRHPQMGAYAPAFGRSRGQRFPTSPRYSPPYAEATSANRLRVREAPSSLMFPGAAAAGTNRPVQRLTPRPVTPSKPRPRRVRQVRRPPSPVVYVVRLLIIGVGVGAIAGTVISALDPTENVASTAQVSATGEGATFSRESTSPHQNLMGVPESGRSLLNTLTLGQPMTPLAEELQSLSGAVSDLNPGIFVYDLDTTDYLSINGEMPFSAASTIKVPILVAFFQDVEAGRINLDDILTMREEDVATGSGDMQFQPVGTQYTALETATKMIIISDNTATNMLIRLMGGANVLNRRFQSWGLTSTAIRNVLPDLEGTNTTSPKDMVALMTLVSQGELLSLRSRDQMLHIMERTRTRTLLPQGLPPDAQIAHKTGDIGSMVGDVGLIDMPNGKRYAITALVQRPHNDVRAQQLIRQVSGTVYQALETAQEVESPNEIDAIDTGINIESSELSTNGVEIE